MTWTVQLPAWWPSAERVHASILAFMTQAGAPGLWSLLAVLEHQAEDLEERIERHEDALEWIEFELALARRGDLDPPDVLADTPTFRVEGIEKPT